MAKKARKVFTIIMALSMMMSLFGLGAYAEDTAPAVPPAQTEPAAPAAPDLYIYKYDGNRYHNGISSQGSSYLLSFRWMRPDNTAAEAWRSYDVSTAGCSIW